MLRWIRGEVAFGFLLASIFWIGVLGWQSAYSPSEIEKNDCYEAAKKSGYKNEECKTFWERTATEPVALFTLVLAFSTVGLWIATIGLYRAGERQNNVAKHTAAAALKSADVAERTLIVTNRPWVAVEIAITSGLKMTSAEARVEFAFTLKNTGSSPANHVQIEARILPEPLGGFSELQKIRDEIRGRTVPEFSALGFTLFPGEVQIHKHNLPLSKSDWQNWLAHKNFPEHFKPLTIELVGAVVYRSTFSRGYHHTAFVASLNKTRPDHPNLAFGLDWQDDFEFPIHELALIRSFGGGSAD